MPIFLFRHFRVLLRRCAIQCLAAIHDLRTQLSGNGVRQNAISLFSTFLACLCKLAHTLRWDSAADLRDAHEFRLCFKIPRTVVGAHRALPILKQYQSQAVVSGAAANVFFI